MANNKTKINLPTWVNKIPGIGGFIDTACSIWDRASPIARWCWPIMVVAAGALAKYWDSLSWELKACAFLVGTYFVSFIFYYVATAIQRIAASRNTKSFSLDDCEDLGKKIIKTTSDMSAFLVERQRTMSDRRRGASTGHPTIDDWRSDRDFEAITGQLLLEKFGATCFGYIAILNGLGIAVPHHIGTTVLYRPTGLINFLGMIGSMLEQGYLEQAIEASKNRELMFSIGA